MKRLLIVAFALVMPVAHAQWQILNSHSTADLRGVDAVGDDVAWASGSNGTILRTEDGGHTWLACAVPPGGANLDFRGVQAQDEKTAVVMATGKGELSRVYKTTDGCQTWKKVFDNPNAAGSFDSLHRTSAFQMYVLGDPVNGKFALYSSGDGGNTWSAANEPGLEAPKGAGAFAAGTADFTNIDFRLAFGTGGRDAAVYTYSAVCAGNTSKCSLTWNGAATPLATASATAGVFALAGRTTVGPANAAMTGMPPADMTTLVAVGGDSERPNENSGSAAFSFDDGETWHIAATLPGGYRSAVAFERGEDHARFIAVGPNGTDVSVDDGMNWHPLKPGRGDDTEADQHWNSISLPFVVGPHGRIGILRADGAGALRAEN